MVRKIKQNQEKNNSRKVKVGVLCIAAVLIFYIGTNFLKGIDVFSKKVYYYTVMDNAGGLQSSNPVFMNGFKIGKVTKVGLLTENSTKIVAELLISEPINFPVDTRLEIAPSGLLGGLMVNVIRGTSSQYFQPKDTLPSILIPQLTDGIEDMKGKLNSILSSIDTIGISLKDVLHTQGGANDLKKSLDNITQTTDHLKEIMRQNKDKIGRLVTNFEMFSKTLKNSSGKLSQIIDNFDNIADSLAKANVAAVIHNVNKTISDINQIVGKVKQGEGTVGQLMYNDTLYKNLQNATDNLNELMIDLKQNPGRYIHFSVFGKKDKKNKQSK